MPGDNGNPFDRPETQIPVSQLFGGMHGGSYDIAFRDPKGQISPDTIKAEAVGGSAGIAADLGAAPLLSAIGTHLSTIKNIIDLGAKLGMGTLGYKEARDLYKEFSSKK